MERFDPKHGGSLVVHHADAPDLGRSGKASDKKKPDVFTSGWEALLLSHIKAPAQGGKAGSGKPPASEFNKDETRFQATEALSLTFKVKNLKLLFYYFP
ncbi:hypothetical protein [Variovorax sp. PAMC26660]|uniref:hypothetical protein n=1 Tax=Variovorax sp. PAMC26660 TaxID=2762322 RepID=UPI00164EABA0|nr:hypothetical protein [Variovorax sp. PAMC26660]QNK71834.1 hypothetical protein H7F35_09335 [Variovorax sp. PAMC26660]